MARCKPFHQAAGGEVLDHRSVAVQQDHGRTARAVLGVPHAHAANFDELLRYWRLSLLLIPLNIRYCREGMALGVIPVCPPEWVGACLQG
jgi:hypothetical protein